MEPESDGASYEYACRESDGAAADEQNIGTCPPKTNSITSGNRERTCTKDMYINFEEKAEVLFWK